MTLFVASFIIMIVAVTAMAIGVIVGGKRIAGSCGGINGIDGLESACSICSKPCAKRRKALEEIKAGENHP